MLKQWLTLYTNGDDGDGRGYCAFPCHFCIFWVLTLHLIVCACHDDKSGTVPVPCVLHLEDMFALCLMPGWLVFWSCFPSLHLLDNLEHLPTSLIEWLSHVPDLAPPLKYTVHCTQSSQTRALVSCVAGWLPLPLTGLCLHLKTSRVYMLCGDNPQKTWNTFSRRESSLACELYITSERERECNRTNTYSNTEITNKHF